MPRFELSLLVDGVDIDDLDQLELLLAATPGTNVSAIDGQVRLLAVLDRADVTKATVDLVRAAKAAVPTFEAIKAELNLVNTQDIATMVGLNRESVRLWVTGRRGPGGFPPPLSTVGPKRSRVWEAAEVECWLETNSLPVPATRSLSLDSVGRINHLLSCERIASQPVAWESVRNVRMTAAHGQVRELASR